MTGPSEKADATSTMANAVDILHTARQLSRYKERSRQTLRDVHLPLINSVSRTPRIMLLGDSMLERLTTTGQSPSLQPWPSEHLLSRLELSRTNSNRGLEARKILHRLSAVFNAGCGGDKIENILYRLVGDEQASSDKAPMEDRQEQLSCGLVDALSKRQTQVKLWVIQVGTNNLHKVKGLSEASLLAMRVLLTTLLHISAPETHILVTALFYREDIRNDLVDQANARIKELVEGLAIQTAPSPTSPLDQEKRRDSVISQAVSASGNSLHDSTVPIRTVDDAVHETKSDSGPSTAANSHTQYAEIKAREDAEIARLEASISRLDFQPECKGAATQFDPFDEQRKRNKYINLQIPHDPEAPRISFLPVPEGFEPKQHLEDHVHLNLQGYRLWMRTLFPVIADLLSRADDMRYAIEQDDNRKTLGEFTKLSKFGTEFHDKRFAQTGRFA